MKYLRNKGGNEQSSARGVFTVASPDGRLGDPLAMQNGWTEPSEHTFGVQLVTLCLKTTQVLHLVPKKNLQLLDLTLVIRFQPLPLDPGHRILPHPKQTLLPHGLYVPSGPLRSPQKNAPMIIR
eukprot:1176754-Prorocentrum_minimum.AAC.2